MIEHDSKQTPSRQYVYNLINFEFDVVTESEVMSKKIYLTKANQHTNTIQKITRLYDIY